jgi:UDP-N-acetylmuramoyl-tripeptide--D-alanyl-D-alanine ligase
MMTLAEVHALLPGSRLIGDGAVLVSRVHSDTRSLRAGDLFVALRGERFDAHDFLPQARAAGAVAALAERGLAEAGLPGLLVDDSRIALGRLAAGWRRRFDLPLIAVTGSNGKTTVTQMIASILRAWHGAGAFATEGNFNNDIGVPLTLLRLRQDATAFHRAGVVELGMNHPGEIAHLAAMTAPTVALVNNAQREHQEFMTSVEAVARENGSVIEALGADGVAVFPADEAHTPLWRALAGGRRVMTFALRAGTAHRASADVGADAVWTADAAGGDHWVVALSTPSGEATLKLRIAGLHNVKNALAATACALSAGCPLDAVVRGLEAFTAVQGRSQASAFERDGRRVTLIDDSYNANPDSVRAAIDVLVGLPAPRWLVLGDMGEVGDQGPAFHREVGAHARSAGVDALWTAGELCAHAAAAYGDAARHFDAVEALLAALPQAPAAASVLVKGSRFIKMERVVAALKSGAAAPSTGGRHAA